MRTTTDPIADMTRRWRIEPTSTLRPDVVPLGASVAVFRNADPAPQRLTGHLTDHWILAWHRDGLLRGRARIAGRTSYDGAVGAGTWVLVPPGDRPWAEVSGAWEVMHLYLPVALLEGAEQVARRSSGRLLFDRMVSDLLSRLHAEVALKDRPAQIAAEGLGLQIAGALLRRSVLGQDGAQGLGGAALARVLRLIEGDPDADVAALARSTGLSRSHFARLFRAATGQSPRDAIGEARLLRARRAVEETDESITQIALAAGYADGAHMARDFRIRLGTTPLVLRRRARRSQ